MKLNKLFLLMFICNPLIFFAQINEHFDGETLSEIWQGDNNLFVVSNNQLQLNASEAGQSYLSAPSSAITNAEWKLSMQMNFNPTSGNHTKFYLCSDNPVLTDALNGYYLQIGGTTDKQISLHRQNGKTNRKLGNSEARRLDMNPAKIEIKVNKDDQGNWTVWSKKPDEDDFTEEFTCQDSTFESSAYAGIVCIYTKTNSTNFFFDLISSSGDAHIDVISPALQSFNVWADSLLLHFSEPIDAEHAVFHFSEPLSYQTEWRAKQAEVIFRFNESLESGKKYTLYLESIPDLSGNILSDSLIAFALVEAILPKDIIVNEVLFNPPAGGVDYVEIYNRSNKTLDLSQLNISNRRNGALYASKSFGTTKILIFPGEYKVLASDKEKICNFYDCQDEESFFTLTIPAYSNDSGYVVLTDKNSVVIDEFKYLSSMHSSFIKDKKGVSLERQSFDNNEWASASEDSGFGTPGYKNSQGKNATGIEESINLGNDVCFPYQDKEGHLSILYHFKKGGYFANISIFDMSGRPIRKLGENMSLSTQGTIYWDGKDDNGRIVPISPYILLFEAFHPNGEIYRKSMVGVVSK
jgi:hypothetical protein